MRQGLRRTLTTGAVLEPRLLRGAALLEAIEALPLDARDAFVDRLLGLEEAPPDGADLPAGGVPYLPCGVDEILAVLREARPGPGSHFVDVGSGIGRVALLAHLITGARATGIEIQARLVDVARARAGALGLEDVRFVHGDASELDVVGDVYLVYAPFGGARLARLLDRVDALAAAAPLTLFTVGTGLVERPRLVARPCTHPGVDRYDALGLPVTASSGTT